MSNVKFYLGRMKKYPFQTFCAWSKDDSILKNWHEFLNVKRARGGIILENSYQELSGKVAPMGIGKFDQGFLSKEVSQS